MDFFWSLEGYGAADAKWSKITRELEPVLKLNFSEYSCPFADSIAIISIILPDEFLNFYSERVFLSRKKRYADVRLRISYKDFVYTCDSQRIRILAEHLQSSLVALGKRMKTDEERASLREIVYRAGEICENYMQSKGVV